MMSTRRFIKVSALGLTLGLTAAQAHPTVNALHDAVTLAVNVANDRFLPPFGPGEAPAGNEPVRIGDAPSEQTNSDDTQAPAPWLLAGAGLVVVLSAARRRSL